MKLAKLYKEVGQLPFVVYSPALDKEVVVADYDGDYVLTDLDGNVEAYANDRFVCKLLDCFSGPKTLRYEDLVKQFCRECSPYFDECQCDF